MVTLSTPMLLLAVAVFLAALAASQRLTAGHWLAVTVFAIYLVGVAHFVLLPLRFIPDAATEYGPIDLGRLIEIRPFFLSGADPMPRSQALLNILLTVPFGFGLPFVRSVRARDVLVVGVLFSVGIELAQLVADALYLALPTWSVDINDVLLNSSGVVLGYLAFRATCILYGRAIGRLPVRRGPWAHFHDVLTQTRPDPTASPGR